MDLFWPAMRRKADSGFNNGDWAVVCLGTSCWVHCDLLGSLQGAKSAVRRATGSTRGLHAGRDTGPLAEGAVDSGDHVVKVMELRRVPWQTPHTYTRDGELHLTEECEQWMHRAMRERASLADDAKAEAGVSELQVAAGARGRMLLDQIRDPGIQDLLERQPGLFRKSAVDDLVERQVKEEATGAEAWVPVVPQGLAVGHTSWR